MRKFSTLLIAILCMLGLAAMIAPASGQNPAPEATVEPDSLLVVQSTGFCTLAPDDSAVAITGDGVYGLPDGRLRFPLKRSELRGFAPLLIDGTPLVFVPFDGIYDLTTGVRVAETELPSGYLRHEKMFEMPGFGTFDIEKRELLPSNQQLFPPFSYPMFSPPLTTEYSQSFSIAPHADFYFVFVGAKVRVYAVDDGELRFEAGIPPTPEVDTPENWFFTAPMAAYDPDSGTVRISIFGGHGRSAGVPWPAESTFVYDAADGTLLGTRGGWEGFVSPDGAIMARSDGVFDAGTRERLFEYQGLGDSYTFSPDSSLLLHGLDGVYDVATGERLYEVDGQTFTFSPDSRWASLNLTGILDARSGAVRLWLTGGHATFSDSSRYIVWGSRTGCRIYRAPEN